jgi:4-hydroxy 2-oxovalerate aldolase
MKNNIAILDCTLRDGGYYNDWNFPVNLSEKYLQTIRNLPINIVEIGYISNSKNDNFGLHYHLNIPYLKKVKKILKKNQKLSCMVNAKEIKSDTDLIKLLLPYQEVVDLVRFAIDPKKINFFLDIISKSKKKIKKISFMINLMYLSQWHSNTNYAVTLVKKIKKIVNNIAFVDSHGSLKPFEVNKFFRKIVESEKDINFGCHFHNNCGLALANSLAAVDAGCKFVDVTVKGMGRGAGNAETELFLAILRPEKINLNSFEIDELLEDFQNLKDKLKWGSSYTYCYSAVNGFSQSEIMDLVFKKRLDANMALIAAKYKKKNIKKIQFKNLKFLKKKIIETPLLIGGGPSFKTHGKYFLSNLKNEVPIILSGSNAFINFLKLDIKIKNLIILILTGSEIKKIKRNYSIKKSQVDYLVIEKDFYVKEFDRLDKNKIVVADSVGLNPLLLVGKMLNLLNIKKLNLAFFDGDFGSEKSKTVLEETVQCLYLIKKTIDIKTFTKTFLQVDKINLWNNDQFLHTN